MYRGVSLTVAGVSSGQFYTEIIPYTFSHTNLKFKRTGGKVNVEFDYLIKALDNILKDGAGSALQGR